MRSFLFKYFKFLVFGLAILLIIETGAMIYVDRSMLKDKTSADIKLVTQTSSAENQNLTAEIDPEAENVKASYTGKYLAFTVGKELKILSFANGKETSIAMDDGMTLGYYKWIYDRDQLIIAEIRKSSSGKSYAKLYNLDAKNLADSSTPSEIRNTVQNTEAKITLSSKSKIVDMDFSTSTVTTYLKISSEGSRDILWQFNIPDVNKAYSLSGVKNIGNIQCLKNESELLYENEDSGRVNVVGKGPLSIDGSEKLKLLGFDNSDNVYLAKGDGASTDTIYYGSIVNDDGSGDTEVNLTPDMKKITLDSPAKLSNIYVTLSGNVYRSDSESRTFENLATGKKISYTGTLKCVYGKGFITESGGTVKENSLD